MTRLLEGCSHQVLGRRALHVIGKTNLLSQFEAMAIRDGLRDLEASRAVFVALASLSSNETVQKEAFEEYVKAVSNLHSNEGKVRVFTWPVVTILPYLANLKMYLFLKPGVTQKAVKRLAFDLHYSAKPNWTTCDALLRMGKIYLELLRPHGATDLIDVQSFIWQTDTSRSLEGSHEVFTWKAWLGSGGKDRFSTGPLRMPVMVLLFPPGSQARRT